MCAIHTMLYTTSVTAISPIKGHEYHYITFQSITNQCNLLDTRNSRVNERVDFIEEIKFHTLFYILLMDKYISLIPSMNSYLRGRSQ